SCSVLLQKWLGTPDGVSISSDQRWIPLSKHDAHGVLLSRNKPPLNESSDPDGILRSVTYPHGVRFTADGRHILVADAGAPYVHVYANTGDGWHGLRNPVGSIRVMDQAVYESGHRNPKEGGPKGLDFDKSESVMVTTCEERPLAFFDLPAILDSVAGRPRVGELRYELHLIEESIARQAAVVAANESAAAAKARAALQARRAAMFKVKAAKAKAKRKAAKGAVRRIAAPLGRLYSAFKRPNSPLFPAIPGASVKAGLTL